MSLCPQRAGSGVAGPNQEPPGPSSTSSTDTGRQQKELLRDVMEDESVSKSPRAQQHPTAGLSLQAPDWARGASVTAGPAPSPLTLCHSGRKRWEGKESRWVLQAADTAAFETASVVF